MKVGRKLAPKHYSPWFNNYFGNFLDIILKKDNQDTRNRTQTENEKKTHYFIDKPAFRLKIMSWTIQGNHESLTTLLLWLPMVLHICFDRFLLAFESRDLSQADKSIKRVFSFPN